MTIGQVALIIPLLYLIAILICLMWTGMGKDELAARESTEKRLKDRLGLWQKKRLDKC